MSMANVLVPGDFLTKTKLKKLNLGTILIFGGVLRQFKIKAEVELGGMLEAALKLKRKNFHHGKLS